MMVSERPKVTPVPFAPPTSRRAMRLNSTLLVSLVLAVAPGTAMA
jgi:hypothetical protein